jgi:hypothetical protein
MMEDREIEERKAANRMANRLDDALANIEQLHTDAMIAHRWFAAMFGEVMNGRDFSVKCPMATTEIEAWRKLHAENERLRAENATLRIAAIPHVTHSDQAWRDKVDRLERELAEARSSLLFFWSKACYLDTDSQEARRLDTMPDKVRTSINAARAAIK